MNRITRKQVEYQVDIINNIFERNKKNTQWSLGGDANGYFIHAGPADGYPGYKSIIYGEKLRNIYYQLRVAIESTVVLRDPPLPTKKERESKKDNHAYINKP